MSTANTVKRCDDCAMRSSGILKDVPEEILKLISCCMTNHKFPSKHLIFLEGNPSDQIGSIRKGALKLSKQGENGKTQIIGSVGPGFMVGYEAFLGKPYQSTVETLTDVELCMTTRGKIMRQMREFPDMAIGFVELLCHRICELEQKTFQLGAFSTRQRLAAYLLSVFESEACSDHKGSVRLTLSRQDIADSLGMAKETLIRLLTKFAENGVITLSGPSITINDPQKLSQILSASV
jgi:CRP-like cAMP-binding protein